MVSFLLIISFLLHVVAIVAIYSLFQQLQSIKKQGTQDIMELMEVYLQEIREENNRLQSELQTQEQTKQEKTDVVVQQEMPINGEKDITDFGPLESEMEDTIEASLESRVLQLHAEGLSNNEIARQLDCGKTEVEIIIKLQNKDANSYSATK